MIMIKIRNIKQLKREQEKLRDRQKQLEKEISESWQKIKKGIRPHDIAKDLVSEWVLNKLTSRGIGKLMQMFN
jgi:predicted transcriptional regulator